MAKELEELVVDARLLAITAKESESKLDAMLRRASLISNKLTCTREYQRDVEKLLVSNGKLDRRKGLLEELQKENRMIKSYEEENSMLRDQLEKSYATLDEIISRHGQIMHRVQNEHSFCHLTPHMLQEICDSSFQCDVIARNEQIEQAQRLMDVMRYCEQVAQRDTETFARIARENRSLRELLNFAGISDPNIIAHFRKSMQEYDKEHKNRVASRYEEHSDDEDVDTSEMFNRTSLSQSSIANQTVRRAPGTSSAARRPPPATDCCDDLSAKVDDILTGIDELIEEEESDAETVLDRDDGRDSEAEENSIILNTSPPITKKDVDADSGTASSLSSSPASSSSSDGDGTDGTTTNH